jgi:sodium-dependent dicarboxylate transporter 2/3/5
MALYWITECMPYAITGILPVVLFPVLGIMKSEEISPIYFKV